MPRRSTWQKKEQLGTLWPKGSEDLEANFVITEHEVNVILASRKEYKWHEMNDHQKKLFAEAADTGWKVWVDNDAVSVLSKQEAAEVRERLRRSGEGSKILQPRFVFTDKNDGLRTPDCPMEIRPSARLVVPGYQDVSAYTIRKDAPTASRVMQHVLFAVIASNFKRGWRLTSADVKSAFLQGDPYIDGGEGSRELFIQNVRHKGDEPSLPLGEAGLARIKKGVFGLADAPRQWHLRLHRALSERGWERSPMDFACWFLWSKDRSTLCFPTWITCFLVEAQWQRHRFWISVVSLDLARSSMTASTTAAKGSLNWMMAQSMSVWKSITRTFNQLLWQLLANRS